MPEIVGHGDPRNRPLVRISIPGHEDTVLALLDTGFNGYLLIHEAIARQLGFATTGAATNVELAGHVLQELYVADGTISWFNKSVLVPVLVRTEERPSQLGPDEPIALIGTALLNPHKLVVDFTSRRVLIAQAE